jgi:hypothetical protein
METTSTYPLHKWQYTTMVDEQGDKTNNKATITMPVSDYQDMNDQLGRLQMAMHTNKLIMTWGDNPVQYQMLTQDDGFTRIAERYYMVERDNDALRRTLGELRSEIRELKRRKWYSGVFKWMDSKGDK